MDILIGVSFSNTLTALFRFSPQRIRPRYGPNQSNRYTTLNAGLICIHQCRNRLEFGKKSDAFMAHKMAPACIIRHAESARIRR